MGLPKTWARETDIGDGREVLSSEALKAAATLIAFARQSEEADPTYIDHFENEVIALFSGILIPVAGPAFKCPEDPPDPDGDDDILEDEDLAWQIHRSEAIGLLKAAWLMVVEGRDD